MLIKEITQQHLLNGIYVVHILHNLASKMDSMNCQSLNKTSDIQDTALVSKVSSDLVVFDSLYKSMEGTAPDDENFCETLDKTTATHHITS